MASDRTSPSGTGGLARRDALRLPFWFWLTAQASAATPEDAPPADSADRQLSPACRSISLNGAWRLTYGPLETGEPPETDQPPADWPTIAATVPGNVELDLVAAGRLEAPERGNRIYKLRKLEDYQWWYRRSFSKPEIRPGERIELVFDGLDCLGTVWVNGKLVGHPKNMLIPHRYDVTGVLRAGGGNEVVVRIDPAVPAGNRVPHAAGEFAHAGCWESLPIRKAPHMYGWDIMPRAVSAGLWRDVRLEVLGPARWSSVYWHTRQASRKRADLGVDWQFVTEANQVDGYRVRMELRRNGKIVHEQEEPALSTRWQDKVMIENPDLWWPRGFGEPALYEASLKLLDAGGKIVDEHKSWIGIRTVELRRTEITTPEAPGDFCFVVNGEPIFIKGTNWTPMDALHSRDRIHLNQVFPMLAELNVNMIRSWGGGVYESDEFFDLCDRTGILVWQDFALACALYPQNEEFLRAMAVEAESVVTRLRNHPSLALWAGNNENDNAYTWSQMPHADPNRDRISREVLPRAIESFDPYRPYLPSSPYHSPAVVAAGNQTSSMPEVHLWGPRGYFKAPFYTTEVAASFASEIGYHGCPSRSSLERMMDPGFVQPWTHGHEWNDEWLTKSVRSHPLSTATAHRNDLMIKQVKAFFGAVPETLDDFILASQITQGEAMKFFVELWRQQKGHKRGLIWWNLRDGWPILSDGVVDYYGTRKMAFHYIQRVQRDVQAICCEARDGRHRAVVVNDTLAPVRGRLAVRRAGSGAVVLEAKFEAAANGVAEAGAIPQPAGTEMWLMEWSADGGQSLKSHYLAARGPVHFEEYRGWMKDLAMELHG